MEDPSIPGGNQRVQDMKKADESDDGEVIGEQKKKKSGGHQQFKYVENKEVSGLSILGIR